MVIRLHCHKCLSSRMGQNHLLLDYYLHSKRVVNLVDPSNAYLRNGNAFCTSKGRIIVMKFEQSYNLAA